MCCLVQLGSTLRTLLSCVDTIVQKKYLIPFKKFLSMSGLLTQLVRRQASMMMPRRNASALFLAGPPVNKVTNKEKLIALGLFLSVPMLYPIYIMSNLQKYNGSNRTWSKKKARSDKKQSGKKADH
ncbi:unnamed protein product [Adineta ricciae]|uniref:Uncharacterized protein n=1 Tax=Adineta ricciae TaxID=249248 RepID=A0A814K037_ADIRI|nr:unnamed protein product [Adineta ricciae]